MAVREDHFLLRCWNVADWVVRPIFYISFFIALGYCFYAIVLGHGVGDPLLQQRVFFAGAIIAATGWLWNGQTTRMLSRKTQAITMLTYLRSEPVLKLKSVVAEYIKDVKNGGKPNFPEKEVDILLSIYETMALAIHRGIADHETIKRSQSFVWDKTYIGLKGYIKQIQEEHTVLLFCHFEKYAIKWSKMLNRYDGTYAKKDQEFFR